MCKEKKKGDFAKIYQDELIADLPSMREFKAPSAISTSKKYKRKSENCLATRLLMRKRTRIRMWKNGCLMLVKIQNCSFRSALEVKI